MKDKKGKLELNKTTIAGLNREEMKGLLGGDTWKCRVWKELSIDPWCDWQYSRYDCTSTGDMPG